VNIWSVILDRCRNKIKRAVPDTRGGFFITFGTIRVHDGVSGKREHRHPLSSFSPLFLFEHSLRTDAQQFNDFARNVNRQNLVHRTDSPALRAGASVVLYKFLLESTTKIFAQDATHYVLPGMKRRMVPHATQTQKERLRARKQNKMILSARYSDGAKNQSRIFCG